MYNMYIIIMYECIYMCVCAYIYIYKQRVHYEVLQKTMKKVCRFWWLLDKIMHTP